MTADGAARRRAVRDAAESDVPAIAAIYGHHVRHGLASFEEEAPGAREMLERYRALSRAAMPYLVAEADGRVRGFACAGRYRARPAYRHTVESSVYVAAPCLGEGWGSLLLAKLIERCEALGFRQMVAVIGDSGNRASVGVHLRHGFAHVGTLRAVGYKHARWVDSVIMQRALGEGDRTAPGS